MFAVELVLLENVARSGKGGGQAKDGEYLGKFIFLRNCKFLSFVRGFNGVFLFFVVYCTTFIPGTKNNNRHICIN